MKCRHERRYCELMLRWCDVQGKVHQWFQEWCEHCGSWLPLGPSNDSDPRVQLEIRAAELADAYNADDGWWDGFVSLGMCSPQAEHAPLIEADIIAGRKWQRDLDDYYAGHLAAEIATHDTRRSTEGEE